MIECGSNNNTHHKREPLLSGRHKTAKNRIHVTRQAIQIHWSTIHIVKLSIRLHTQTHTHTHTYTHTHTHTHTHIHGKRGAPEDDLVRYRQHSQTPTRGRDNQRTRLVSVPAWPALRYRHHQHQHHQHPCRRRRRRRRRRQQHPHCYPANSRRQPVRPAKKNSSSSTIIIRPRQAVDDSRVAHLLGAKNARNHTA